MIAASSKLEMNIQMYAMEITAALFKTNILSVCKIH